MKKVLIISYYFPPINMIASKRYGTMCKYFAEYGYEPYVLTTNHDRNTIYDVGLDMELPIAKEQIIRIGKNASNTIVKSILGNTLISFLAKHKYISRTIGFTNLGWYEKVKSDIHIEKLKNIDIIVGTYPDMCNLFVAHYLSKVLECPYIADIRDLISDYTEVPAGYKRTKWLDRMLEGHILGSASGIVTVTRGFKDILKQRFSGKKFKVVFNGWDCKICNGSVTDTEKYLYYAGSLYQHRLESFSLVVRCIKKINEEQDEKIRFIVRSIGPEQLDVQAKKIIMQNKMQEYISILTSENENTVRKEQERAYINVALSTIHKDDKALMTTVPGKVYELLTANAPVLAIVPKNSDVDRILRYTNKGLASISEEEIINFILRENGKYSGNGKENFFSRKRQALRLCRFMDEVLGE